MPITDQEADHQRDADDAEKELIKENQIEHLDNIPPADRAKLKLRIFKFNWGLYKAPKAVVDNSIGTVKIDTPGFFPFIRPKEKNKGNIIAMIS